MAPLPAARLPEGIRARIIPGINGLAMHVLEAGDPGRPLLLLLHGFPELAWSWRRVMPGLAALGYHVVAPDQRGYGRTTGWSADYDGDLAPFRLLNLVRDAMGLIAALGHDHAAAVIGHDFGSPVAAWCALVRPDLFRRVALMSAPFAGPPALPEAPPGRARPADIWHPPQGLHAFLRAYYHMKSADWAANRPYPLPGWDAASLAQLPTYYIMDHALGMAATVAPEMPDAAAVAACRWLPEADLAVYVEEFGRTGFQGGLNWYRCRTTGLFEAEHEVFAGRRIDVPALFIAGAADWGAEQTPGALQRMREACPAMGEIARLPGAGHWVQQEQPEAVLRCLRDWLASA